MGFADDYINKRIEALQMYLKYCNHSVKKRKLEAELKIWQNFDDRRDQYETSKNESH